MTEARRCQAQLLDDLRTRVSRIERGRERSSAGEKIPFGVASLDAALPEGGLAQGSLHEVFGAGPDIEFGATAALLVAGIVARLGARNPVGARAAGFFRPRFGRGGGCTRIA